MTATEAVELARQMRDAGVEWFEFEGFKCNLRQPDPPPLTSVLETMRERPIEERDALLKQLKKDRDADLFGAT
jgi:hypothetical protein